MTHATPSTTPAYWAPRIRLEHDRFTDSMRSTHAAAIALGKQLLAAKEALPHGEFGRLFSDSTNPVAGALPFRSNWANRLMRFAENPVLSSPHHGADLPADLNAIHELATMADDDLTSAIEAGRVTPKTTRKEAKAIKVEFSTPKASNWLPFAFNESPQRPPVGKRAEFFTAADPAGSIIGVVWDRPAKQDRWLAGSMWDMFVWDGTRAWNSREPVLHGTGVCGSHQQAVEQLRAHGILQVFRVNSRARPSYSQIANHFCGVARLAELAVTA